VIAAGLCDDEQGGRFRQTGAGAQLILIAKWVRTSGPMENRKKHYFSG
jgi:hypothetical protein